MDLYLHVYMLAIVLDRRIPHQTPSRLIAYCLFLVVLTLATAIAVALICWSKKNRVRTVYDSFLDTLLQFWLDSHGFMKLSRAK